MHQQIRIQQIKEDLGEEYAKSLQDLYPGRTIYISNDPNALEFKSPDARNQYILNLWNSGKKYDYISDKVGLSREYIRKIISKQIREK